MGPDDRCFVTLLLCDMIGRAVNELHSCDFDAIRLIYLYTTAAVDIMAARYNSRGLMY